jgi:hypothetical protein
MWLPILIGILSVDNLRAQNARERHTIRQDTSLSNANLQLLLSAVPWDSICTHRCHVILVDSLIRPAIAPGIVSKSAQPYYVITEKKQAGIMIPRRLLAWGRFSNGKRGGDTTDVIISVEDEPSAPTSPTFLVQIDRHDNYGIAVRLSLVWRNAKWTVVRRGIEEG